MLIRKASHPAFDGVGRFSSEQLEKLRERAQRIGKVLLCSAAYDQRVFLAYHKSIVYTCSLLSALGVTWDHWIWPGDFHVERAVNGLMTRFMNSDYDQMLWIDTDEDWKAEDVVRIFLHEEECVAGVYRTKNDWEKYPCSLVMEDGQPHGKMLADGTALLAATQVPGGFLKTRKSALQKVAPRLDWYHWTDAQTGTTEKHYAFFWNKIIANEFFGMDASYCIALREAGVQLWVDPMIQIGHFGTTRYDGNYDKYLRMDRKAQEAFNIVREMAKA